MGICEEAKDCKPEETSSPLVEQQQQQQQTSHVYSDWASMQAYYAPRMAVPPYFSSALASGHTPSPYMWGPLQHMMPPYTAIYPHGGAYAHPGVTVACNPKPTSIPIDSPTRSLANSDRGLIKKLKGIDDLTISLGYNNRISKYSRETEGSSEGSDGNTSCKNGRKRIRGASSTSSEVGTTEQTDANGICRKATGITILGKEVGAGISGYLGTELELKKSPAAANMAMLPSTLVLQDERELKRERRKQSNRESARRSRLRKQAEVEELGAKVESLSSENLKLKSEINQLTVNSANLKLQNAKLLEKLKAAKPEQTTQDPRPDKNGLSLSTANLLSRVDNRSGSAVGDATGSSSGSGAPLHQLLDASPRADAVAAS